MSDVTRIVITGRDATQAAFASVSSGLGRLQSGFSSLNAVAGALGASLSVAAIAAWAQETIAAASALDDLADATGSTVESLSKLSNIAKVSGADFGTIDQAVKKLAVGLAGADEESGKAGKALAALGISARDPAQAMLEIAKRFDDFRDGPEKAALAMQIFGKAGASLLPILKDIAQNQDIVGTVTTKQAADAESLEKSWRRLAIEGTTLKNVLLSDIVPALTTVIGSFTAARNAGMGFWEALKNTGNYDLIGAQKQLMGLETEISKAERSLQSYLERGDKGLANQLQPKIDEMKRQAALLQSVVNQLVTKMPDRVPVEDKPAAPKMLDEAAAAKKAAEAARAAAAAAKEWKEQEDALADALSRHNKIQEDLAKGVSEMQANFAAYVDKQSDAIRAYEEQTAAIGKTVEELNLLELARQAEIRDMRLMAGWGDDAIRIYEDWAAAIRKRNAALSDQSATRAAEEQAKATQRVVDDFTNSAADFLEDFAHNGSKAFKNLWNDFVSWGLKAIAQIAARQIVLSIGGVAGSGNAIAGALGGGGGGSGGLGSLGSMGQNYAANYAYDSAMGVYSAYMAATTPAATTAAMGSASLATSMYGGAAAEIVGGAALAADGTVVGAGMMAGLEAAMLAVPVAGWVALAAAIVYGIVQGMEEGPAERLADFVSGAAAKGGNPKFASESKFGAFGFVNDSWFSDDPGFVKAIESITTAVKGLDNSIAGMVGDDMAATIAAALATHTQSVSMGSEDANLDQVAAMSGAQILLDRYQVVLGTINSSLDDLLQGFSGTGAELAVFVTDIVAVYEALQKTDVADIFGGDATVEAFQALRLEGETLGAAFNRIAGEFQITSAAADLIGGSFGEAGLATAAAREQLIQFAGGAAALAQNLQTFDQAFYTDAERLTRTQDAVTEAMEALNLTLPDTRDGFRALVEGLDLATESGRQTYAAMLGLASAADAIYDAAEAAKASIRTGDSRISDQNNYGELAVASAATTVSRALQDSMDALAAWDARDLGSYSGGWNAAEPTQKDAAVTAMDWSGQVAQKEIELLQAQGKALEALNARRELELASLVDAPEELRALVVQLYDLQAAAIADAAAAKLAAEARQTLIEASASEIAAYKMTIDAFLTPLGELDAAMKEIAPPALTLVDLWQQNKTEMESLADALAEIDGSKATTAIEKLSQTMQQIEAISGVRSGIASNIVDLKASKGDASAVAFLKAQEASLTAQLATATDKGSIAQALTATVMKRIQIEGQLEQRAINEKWSAEQDALTQQIDLAREARQVEIDALRERIQGVERLREAAAGIADYLTALRAGNLSPLSYTDRLAESKGLFESTLRDALGGNADALGSLRGNAQDYLGQAQQYFGGATGGYASVFSSVTSALEQFGLAGMAGSGTDALQAQLDALESIKDATEKTAAEQVDTTDRQIAAYEALDATFARVETGLKDSAQEQTAAIKEQVAELKTVVENQEAQIRQAADAYAKMLEKLADMNAKLDDLKSDATLATAAA